jgi:hypothetical protein
LAEQLIRNQQVRGSIPRAGSIVIVSQLTIADPERNPEIRNAFTGTVIDLHLLS